MNQVNNPGAFTAVVPDVELEPGTRCVQCGGDEITLVRKDPKGNHRLKCLGCTFTFTQDNATQAAKLGAIPESSSEAALASAEDPEVEHVHAPDLRSPIANDATISALALSTGPVPRTPKYVFVSKDRNTHEFVGQREFKRAILRWEQQGKYDLFELTLKKADVKVNIG